MSTTKLNFTKPALQKLPLPPAGRRDYYRDEREKGLLLDVRSTGSMTFYLYKKVNGKPERMYLGQFPDMSIENARKASAGKKGEIAQGQNPQDEKRNIRNEITFGELFTMYLERHSKLHKRSWQYDEREVTKFLSHWFKRKISDITKNEVQKLHTQIRYDNGLYQANRTLERIRAIYNKGIEWGWDGLNPASKIKKFREKSRDRFLQAEELPRFFEALALEENEVARDFFMVALLTGARKSNVMSMRWNELDLKAASWRIPETKNGEPLLIPLSSQALQILLEREKKSESIWVFPGTGKEGHLNDPKKAWHRVLKRAGIADLRVHDLRRTLGSWQAAIGANSYIIGKSLGHKSPQSTAIYARLNLDPVRDSVGKATDLMLQIGERKHG